jgi:hypothetical protein
LQSRTASWLTTFGSGLSAHATKRNGGGVLAVLAGGGFVNFPGRNPADHDGGTVPHGLPNRS